MEFNLDKRLSVNLQYCVNFLYLLCKYSKKQFYLTLNYSTVRVHNVRKVNYLLELI